MWGGLPSRVKLRGGGLAHAGVKRLDWSVKNKQGALAHAGVGGGVVLSVNTAGSAFEKVLA